VVLVVLELLVLLGAVRVEAVAADIQVLAAQVVWVPPANLQVALALAAVALAVLDQIPEVVVVVALDLMELI
jgi:hypothetical protein